MAVMTIRSGLRRLDFEPTAGANAKTHVIVEFAHSGQLAHDQVVRINLGLRNGIERVLEGFPTLVPAPAKGASEEFVYRLEGDIR
jgi:hypothetical protein